MQTSYYSFTIKCIRANYTTTECETKDVMKELIARHHAILVSYEFELDSINRLHIHGTFMARSGIRLSLYQKKFWSIHIDKLQTIQDVQNWTNYIHKQDQECEKAVLANYSFINEHTLDFN